MAKVTTEQLRIAEQNNVSKTTVYARLKNGWDIQKAITKPAKQHQKAGIKGGRYVAGRFLTEEQLETASANNIPDTTLWNRMNNRWDIERAITQSTRRKNRLGETVSAEDEMDRDEVVKVISRIKAINKADTSGFPILVPKPLMKKAERLGIDYEAVEADDSIEQEAMQI